MKTSVLMSSPLFHVPGLMQFVFLFLMLPLTTPCFSDPPNTINSIPWGPDDFENYANLTPLVGGTNGWYASSSDCIVQQNVKMSGEQAAMIPVDVVLSNRFDNNYSRVVRMEMYVQPQLYDGINYPEISGTNYPGISTNAAAQFFINSNGYFVISNGTNWNEVTKMANGDSAKAITNTYFTKIQVNLRYKNHTWNLKAWSNNTDTLMANTYYVNFTSNLNTFSGFNIYNGNSTSYVDDVSVISNDFNLLPKINGVPFDNVRTINGVQPALINGIYE